MWKSTKKDRENYRPISLLSIVYKLFAKLMQVRLWDAIDHRLLDTQFGFRKLGSTMDSLLIITRLQKIFKAKRDPLYVLLLDWEETFDEIDPNALDKALWKIGMDEHYKKLIGGMYDSPTFKMVGMGNESIQRLARTGIRQSCPLSPYLFLILHAAILKDARTELKHDLGSEPHLRTRKNNPTDYCHADDTLVVSRTGEVA